MRDAGDTNMNNRNITLIGMAGVGKSAVGKKLASKLHYKFIDIDPIIEKHMEMKLQHIIDKFGDAEFIRIEENSILNLKRGNGNQNGLDKLILSPGGSIVYSPRAMGFLRKNSTVVFLDGSMESILERVHNLPTRGIVGLKNKTFEELFDERLVLYRRYANFTVELQPDFESSKVAEWIIKKLKI